MQRIDTDLAGLIHLRPTVFSDARGYFMESYNERAFTELTGLRVSFVQDNESCSERNVLRGLHFQTGSHAQGKLIRVVRGAVLDVCVDIRLKSPTFGRHYSVLLNDENKEMLYIPEGFAHGFVTLVDFTIFTYKCTAFYHKPAERTLLWNDPDLGIDWGVDAPTISEKDRMGTPFKELFKDPSMA